ncbi:MAG TPA: MFS transporter, partial [Janibacter terrae]|nr:MFS transporter [Janibacter terrae]
GRVNAAQSTAFMTGGVLGPLAAGFLLDRDLGGAFIGTIVAGLVLTGWVMLRLERLISPEVNGVARTASPTGSSVG